MLQRVMSRLSVEIFLSHGTKKNVATSRCIGKLRVSKKLFAKVGSRFSVDNFWSHRTEKLRKGTLVFQNIFDKVKTFKDRRGVGYHVFPSKVFVSHSTEKIRWESFVFQKTGSKISHISRFSVDNFLSHSTEKNLLQHFGVSENFGYRKNFLQRGITIFCRKLFV